MIVNVKKLLLTSAIVSFTMASGLAQAETVQDHYKNVIVQKPYTVQVCTQGNGKSDITNLLEGAIIGGAIGNNIPGSMREAFQMAKHLQRSRTRLEMDLI